MYGLNIYAGSTATATPQTNGKVGIGTNNPINALDVAGNISASNITASLFYGTASLANTASSLNPNNSYKITNLTASIISSSAITSSNIYYTGTLYQNNNNKIQNGIISNSSFGGSPYSSSVSGLGYNDTNYTIAVMGIDARSWTYSNKTNNGFIINTNSSTALTGEVSYTVIHL